MKRRLALILFLALCGASAKSYHFKSVDQDVFFRPDGTVRVQDTRTYVFDGTFSKAALTIESAAGGGVTFRDVQALDGKAPAAFEADGNRVLFDVHAHDETRTFRVTYDLTGEVQVATDAAKFDRQVLEPKHAAIERYQVRLHAPGGAPALFKVFVFTGRGSVGELRREPGSAVSTVTLRSVKPDEFVRTRVLVDPHGFGRGSLGQPKLTEWLAQTAQEMQAPKAPALVPRPTPAAPRPAPAAWLVRLPWQVDEAALLLVIVAYFAVGREPRVARLKEAVTSPPEDLPPALAPVAATQNVTFDMSAARSATLIDLVRRGHLGLADVRDSQGFPRSRLRLLSPPRQERPAFELALWRWLEAASVEGAVQPGRLEKQQLAVLKQEFETALKEAANALGTRLDERSKRWSDGLALVLFLLALLGALVSLPYLFLLPGFGWSLLPASAALLVIAFASTGVLRWTAQGLAQARRWNAYKHFLGRRLRASNDLNTDQRAEALAYAVAFGLSPHTVGPWQAVAGPGRQPPAVRPAPQRLPPTSFQDEGPLTQVGMDMASDAVREVLQGFRQWEALQDNLGNFDQALNTPIQPPPTVAKPSGPWPTSSSDSSSSSDGGFYGSSSGDSSGSGSSSDAW